MRTRSALILGLVLLFGTTTLAQDYAKVEVPVGYSYMRFNPENSNIVSSFPLNGGNGFTKATKTRAISVTKPESFFGSSGVAEPRPYSTVRREPQIALQRPEQAAVNQFVFQE